MVLERPGLAHGDFREPDAHGSALIERPAGAVRSPQLSAEPDTDAKLLPELPVQSGFGSLARLYLAAGKFPHAGELRGCCPPGDEEPAGIRQRIEDGAAHHLDKFSHGPSLWGTMGQNGRSGNTGRAFAVEKSD